MRSRRGFLAGVLTALSASFAGCTALSGGPRTQESPIRLVGNNTANSSYTAEVFLVPPSSEIRIVLNDGRDYTSDVPDHSYSSSAGEGYYTKIDPSPAQFVGNLTMAPGEVVERRIRNRPVDTKILIVFYDEQGRIPEYHIEDCANYGFWSVTALATPHGPFVDVVCN